MDIRALNGRLVRYAPQTRGLTKSAVDLVVKLQYLLMTFLHVKTDQLIMRTQVDEATAMLPCWNKNSSNVTAWAFIWNKYALLEISFPTFSTRGFMTRTCKSKCHAVTHLTLLSPFAQFHNLNQFICWQE